MCYIACREQREAIQRLNNKHANQHQGRLQHTNKHTYTNKEEMMPQAECDLTTRLRGLLNTKCTDSRVNVTEIVDVNMNMTMIVTLSKA